MNAFETELGLMTELSKATNEHNWSLPTDIQSEAIPQILGGGDVLMAAETGSGKTGAFCLPVLQVVYETLYLSTKHSNNEEQLTKLSVSDKSACISIDTSTSANGLACQSTNPKIWGGCRATRGVYNGAKAYFECTMKDQGICRVGWTIANGSLDLGTDDMGFGYGGTGKKSHRRQFDTYGEPFTLGDTIGCFIDLSNASISWSKNNKFLGRAYTIPTNMLNEVFIPTVCMKNSTSVVDFKGSSDMKIEGYSFIDRLPFDQVINVKSNVREQTNSPNAPLCIVIEPSRELAEQTCKQFRQFKKFLPKPITELLLIGGIPIRQQLDTLQNEGAHIVVATPGRLDDLVSQRVLDLSCVKFFVLDELDGLLQANYKELISRLHKQIPQYTDKGRLQMIVCSATLHNFDVKKLANDLMHFPIWIDLKGQDSVPDTVHHCVCYIDPLKDDRWKTLPRRSFAPVDQVHANSQLYDKDLWSEAVKLLKSLYIKTAIEKFKMDRCLIFCRTKLDCDNLEAYFSGLGGGPRAPFNHQFSCVCLHGDRNANERKNNLEAFKQSKVRLLLCTDVAARGLDIAGLPFVINAMLPDEKSNYIHRIGRVGRAERMGLAISFCANVQEKVWYHGCPSRGKNCFNTKLTSEGGCCIWYNEKALLAEIEEHLGETICTVGADLNIPVDEFQGKVTYGQKLSKLNKSKYADHVDEMSSAVEQLSKLEYVSQSMYLKLKQTVH